MVRPVSAGVAGAYETTRETRKHRSPDPIEDTDIHPIASA